MASVRLVLEGRDTTDPSLTQVIETSVNQPLSMVQVRESITHLFSLGRFEEVTVDATLDNGRVALRYDLTPIHPVTSIRFTGRLGEPGVDESALRRTIVDRYGATPPIGRVDDMVRLLQDALRERGYLHPSVDVRSERQHGPERSTLVFAVDPGFRTLIGRVEILGDPIVPREELIARLHLASGFPYQREDLTQRIDRQTADRRARGYYEARIVPDVQFADNDRVANLTVTVSPGPRTRVVFRGDPLPADRRDELVPVGREGSVDEDLLEDSTNRIEEFLRAQGYRAALAPHTREEANGELLITFTVKKGPQYRVASYDVEQNTAIARSEFDALLKVREGQPFSDARLDADVATIEDLYHRRGFAAAKAQAAVDPQRLPPDAPVIPVAVRIVVREGVRTVVDSVAFDGARALDEPVLRQQLQLLPGRPYVPAQLAVDRDAVQLAYQNVGYQSATVDAIPQFSADGTRVAIRFAIREGPRIFVDHVLIVGNVRTSSDTISRELQVKQGDPFSLAAINESQRRLAALGLFRRARISELRHGDETTRDLLVTIEEAPPTVVGYGAGVEGKLRRVQTPTGAVDEFALAPRAAFEVGRRNLFGKNRSINFFSSISANRLGLAPEAETSNTDLTEYRVGGTFREPRVFNTTADMFVNATFEQQLRTGFSFSRRSLSANVGQRVSPTVSITGTYLLQRTKVFNLQVSQDDRLYIDRTFPQFRLSSFSGSVIYDTRNDAVDPVAGAYASANVQVAGLAIGSEVGFAKSFFTLESFRQLPRASRFVFAGNARLGIANGFANRGELPASERFFAGGDTTNRGFALDTLGVRHIPAQEGDTIDEAGFPIGGNGVFVLMGEVRARVAGGLGVVGFVDTGNVFAHATDIDLTELRSAVGGGIRYKSPFGPIRLDVGFKVHPQPGEGLTAWFISFGQAF